MTEDDSSPFITTNLIISILWSSQFCRQLPAIHHAQFHSCVEQSFAFIPKWGMELRSEKRLVRFFSEVKQREPFSWGGSESLGKESTSSEYEFSPSFLGGNGRSRLAETFRFGKSEVFPKDHEPLGKKIFDPGSNIFLKWNQVFMVSCLVAVFVDPLYFYLPKIGKNDMSWCVKTDLRLRIIVTLLRTFTDLFYLVHVIIKFRTAYITPGSGVFGKGELVKDRKKITQKYLRSDFFIDLISMLPLPQIVIWFVIPAMQHQRANHNNNALALIVLIQYIPRLYLVIQLSTDIVESTGVITMAWAGAAYNLLLYILASHFLGAAWYLLAVDRYTSCWKSICKKEEGPLKCLLHFLDCDNVDFDGRIRWAERTNAFNGCDPNRETSFKYGIFETAVTKNVVSSSFAEKYFYCLWWGLQNLSSYGQNLTTTTFMGETAFAVLIAILGLVLSAHLIGNMQTYLKSLTVRREEWRLKKRDTEEWMRHRQLPEDLRQRVRRFLQYKWVATRGVDEKAILSGLPADSRRDIQRHLCLDLVRRVPFFSQMDDQLLDAICEHLVSSLSTEGTYIVREGEHVTEMLFILRGKLESSTTNGGRTGFYNSIMLRPGDFCGEELLAWALLPISTVNLPSSTRTVKALSEVEAFVLQAEDLKFVANQFRRLHSKKLQHTFRLCSHHWRSWAAFFIQAAWRRYKRKLMTKALLSMESFAYSDGSNIIDKTVPPPPPPPPVEQQSRRFPAARGASVTLLASRFARGAQNLKGVGLSLLQKPEEPDFSAEPDD